MRTAKMIGRSAMIGVLCSVMILSGCSMSQVQTGIQKVIADMPTILSIATEIITIVGAAKGDAALTSSLQQQASGIEGTVVTDLKIIQSTLTSYQNGLTNAPTSVLTKLDNAVVAVQQNLTSLETIFNVTSPTTQAAIGSVTAAVGAFLIGVISLIPQPVAMAMLPKASRLSARIPAPSATYIIPTSRALAQSYNASVEKSCPKARVHVPWVRLPLVNVPVLP